MTGGGSGGHITPILAVAHELKKLQPSCRIVYIGQKGDNLSDVPEKNGDIDKVYKISSGKFRRYHKAGIWQSLDVSTNVKNIRDAFRVVVGVLQSYRLLGKLQPDAIFVKGALGVPVGLAASARHIPIMTHDSDAVPGLAHRIIARWVTIHATALPKEYYNYSPENTEVVGVPVSDNYKSVNQEQQNIFKKEIKLDKYKQVLLITGGGQGATAINSAAVDIMPKLLEEHKDLVVVHFLGRANEDKVSRQYNSALTEEEKGRVVTKAFVEDFYHYSGAADLIIGRAGATNLAEFAIQGKACVIIPSPHLVGGHQLQNAKALAEQDAIKLVNEADGNDALFKIVNKLLDSDEERKKLATNLHRFASPDAAKKLAVSLLNLRDNKQ